MTRGQPDVQEGEFLEVEPPRRLVHTWEGAGKPGLPSTVTYVLERIESGTRLTLRHAGKGVNLRAYETGVVFPHYEPQRQVSPSASAA